MPAAPSTARQWFTCKPREGGGKKFLRFMRRIDRAVSKPRDVHLVLDNYAPHKTPKVQAWLEKHPRFKRHFTPTGAPWLNMVERFFAEITTEKNPARQLHKRRRPGDRHLRLPGAAQCKAKALDLDQGRRRHSRERTARAGQTR
jgi:hypothetical protein